MEWQQKNPHCFLLHLKDSIYVFEVKLQKAQNTLLKICLKEHHLEVEPVNWWEKLLFA